MLHQILDFEWKIKLMYVKATLRFAVVIQTAG
jgi:hypothetical protein